MHSYVACVPVCFLAEDILIPMRKNYYWTDLALSVYLCYVAFSLISLQMFPFLICLPLSLSLSHLCHIRNIPPFLSFIHGMIRWSSYMYVLPSYLFYGQPHTSLDSTLGVMYMHCMYFLYSVWMNYFQKTPDQVNLPDCSTANLSCELDWGAVGAFCNKYLGDFLAFFMSLNLKTFFSYLEEDKLTNSNNKLFVSYLPIQREPTWHFL